MQNGTTTETQEKPRQAVVIGAGIAGLLATRALAEYYEQVLVVERDALPAEPRPCAGTPQSHHLHRVLPRGKMILERLFPGFLDGLLEHGAFSLEHTKSLLIAKDGRTALSAPNATGKDVSCSRALLEWEIRKRVQALAGVRFLSHQDVIGLVASPDRKRITGICVREHGQLVERTTLAADLIVDASGCSSKLPTGSRNWAILCLRMSRSIPPLAIAPALTSSRQTRITSGVPRSNRSLRAMGSRSRSLRTTPAP
ncbi:NAD(P)/FAD-dependent oxidoreductase [Ktedonobacter sp. SOSP1-52]|uniref:FAD-dependent oxidoreductase n=1 Tax=Ktedonobacter sp. SOSP1-52 TaxID=2778366 RepID=UPI001914EA5D|nr:hypothetical protein [Ktedonobacter sp. SOSP1-52]